VATSVRLTSSVSTVYFQVSGTTSGEIFDSLEANGPADSEGETGLGLTSWAWSYPSIHTVRTEDGCVIGDVTGNIALTVTLPELTNYDSLPLDTQQHWAALAAEVAKHEQTHVDIVVEAMDEVTKQIEALAPEPYCNDLKAEVENLWSDEKTQINTRQDAFHAEDEARIRAKRAPLEAQVEANRKQLVAIEAEVDALDSELSTKQASLDSMSAHLDATEAEISQIEAQHPSGDLPPDEYARYQALIDDYNATLVSYNSLVDEFNAAVDHRKTLVNQHDALSTATNGLIEDLNWLR
jgi:predicted secreted Zn-dependent protease